MSIADLDRAFSLIESNAAQADFEGAKEERLIAHAEQTLGLRFPPTYRKFLRRYGSGDIAGQEFYGVIKEDFVNSSVPDAVWVTLNERKTSGLPANLIVIYATSDGIYYALDCSQKMGDGECPVVAWMPGSSKAPETLEVVAKDFGVFMLETLRRVLK